MNIKIRKILYFTFILAFLISAPLVVLYTAGYRYNFGSGKIMQTGVISVTSVPKGADIYIDDERQRSRSPAVIDNVFPGEHEVRLEKEGYESWSRQIKVKAKETTFLEEVGLFVDQEPELRFADPVLRVYPGPEGRVFAYLTLHAGLHELWTYHPASSERKLIARLTADPERELNLMWSADGSYLSLQEVTLSLISTQTAKNTDLANASPGWWDASCGDTYYFFQQGNLKSVRLPEREINNVVVNQATVQNDGNDLLVAQKIDNRVVIAKNQGETSEIFAYLPLGDYYFAPSPRSDILLVHDENRERIFLIDKNAHDQPILLNSVAVLWQWAPDGNSLLYSDGFDLHIYFLNEHADETLTRLSEPITGLAWYAPAQNVLYSQADKIVAVDLDRHQGNSLTTLIEGKNISDLLIDPRGRALYFYGQIGDEEGLFVKKLLR